MQGVGPSKEKSNTPKYKIPLLSHPKNAFPDPQNISCLASYGAQSGGSLSTGKRREPEMESLGPKQRKGQKADVQETIAT